MFGSYQILRSTIFLNNHIMRMSKKTTTSRLSSSLITFVPSMMILLGDFVCQKKIFLISSFQPHLLFFCVYKSDINIIFCGFLLFETLQNHIPKNYSEHPKESWVQGTLTSIKCGLHDKRNYKFAKIGSFEDNFFFLGLKKPLLDVWISLQRTCFVSDGQKKLMYNSVGYSLKTNSQQQLPSAAWKVRQLKKPSCADTKVQKTLQIQNGKKGITNLGL